MIIFRGEPVEIESMDFGSSAEDSYINAAYWTKTGVNLTDDEMDALNDERTDVISERWMERMIDCAETRYELMRDAKDGI